MFWRWRIQSTKLTVASSVKIRLISSSLKFKFWSKCVIGFNIANYVVCAVDEVAMLFVWAGDCYFGNDCCFGKCKYICLKSNETAS